MQLLGLVAYSKRSESTYLSKRIWYFTLQNNSISLFSPMIGKNAPIIQPKLPFNSPTQFSIQPKWEPAASSVSAAKLFEKPLTITGIPFLKVLAPKSSNLFLVFPSPIAPKCSSKSVIWHRLIRNPRRMKLLLNNTYNSATLEKRISTEIRRRIGICLLIVCKVLLVCLRYWREICFFCLMIRSFCRIRWCVSGLITLNLKRKN